MTRKRGTPRPTWTSLVMDALIKADDFMSFEMVLRAVPKITSNLTTATIHHLSKHKCIDSVVGGDGKLWWYATPATDTRVKALQERVPEEAPRNRRARSRPQRSQDTTRNNKE